MFPIEIAAEGAEMMEEGSSIVLFIALIALVAVASAVLLPRAIRRLSIRRTVAALALAGPVLAGLGGLIGAATMTLSGSDFYYSMIVAVAAGLSAGLVGWRLGEPMAQDLTLISDVVERFSHGDRSARTGLERPDEIGQLAAEIDQLCSSVEAAEEARALADEERDQLARSISHDLRTPISSLLLSLEALSDRIGDPDAHLRSMRSNVYTLDRLIDDMFLLAKADSGSLRLHFEPIDLAEVVDDVIDALAPIAERYQVELKSTFHHAVAVFSEHTALARILQNLLENAIRHSPARGVVTVDWRVEQRWVRLGVFDQGEGFTAEFMTRATQRFSQADPARSSAGRAGLGLSIVAALVRAHGGEIQLAPGPGGRVEIQLPAA